MQQIYPLQMQQWVEITAEVAGRHSAAGIQHSPKPVADCCTLSLLCLLPEAAELSKAERHLCSPVNVMMEGQLCLLHCSSWLSCFKGLMQELIQLTQQYRTLNEYLVSKIYGHRGSGPLTHVVLAVHFFIQMPTGHTGDVCPWGRRSDTLYSPI